MTILPNRQTVRLQTWDYRAPAYYFVTICTHGRENLFENEQFKEIAANGLLNLPQKPYAQHLVLDEWVVMPNHVHAIFIFTKFPEETNNLPPEKITTKNSFKNSLGMIVGMYKEFVTRRINCLRQQKNGRVWQRGYYEHIIRGEKEWRSIQQYIINNPKRWAEDQDNLDHLIAKMTPSP